MSMRSGKRLTRRSAARALDRTGPSGAAHVDDVLAAATAPPTGAAPHREDHLVALYRTTRLSNAPAAERDTVIQIARKHLAAAKVAVAATSAVLLAGGGVAFAASTGNLPEVLGGDHRSDSGDKHASAAPGQQATRTPRPTSTGGPTAPAGTPDPSLKGLCNAFQKGSTTNPGKAAENPAFSALAAAAGGRENIATYCIALIGAPGSKPTTGPSNEPTDGPPPGPTPGADPTHPVRPTHPAHPTQAANPTKAAKTPNPNKPTAKPTQAADPNAPTRSPNPNKPTKTPRN